MNKPLTYEELIAFAKEHYTEGGDAIYECWEEYQYNDYVKEFGPITKEVALEMFNFHLEIWNNYQATIF